MIELGKKKKLDISEIKTIWPTESNHLSPWIAQNIDLINVKLNLDVEIDNLEESVENFRLDLAGNENFTQTPVVIENQFGKSDHDHLGKLITYSAHKDAGIIIWIANEIQPPHRKAIEWLNTNTSDEMLFFGLELEVWKIDDSKPAPHFTKVAGPLPTKTKKIIRKDSSPKGEKYLKFFKKSRSNLLKESKLFRSKSVWSSNYWNLPIGRSGFTLSPNFSRDNKFKVELYNDTGNKEDNDFAFSCLREKEKLIEEKLGYSLEWYILPDKRACRIYIAKEGSIENNEMKLEELIKFAVPELIKFKELFTSLIKQIKFPKLEEIVSDTVIEDINPDTN